VEGRGGRHGEMVGVDRVERVGGLTLGDEPVCLSIIGLVFHSIDDMNSYSLWDSQL